MKLKKYAAIAVLVPALTLSACNGGGDDGKDDKKSDQNSSKVDETTEPTDEPTDEATPPPADEEEPKNTTSDYKAGHKVETDYLTLYTPKEWEDITGDLSSVDGVQLAWGEKVNMDKPAFRTNINVIAVPLPKGFDEAKTAETFKGEIESLGGKLKSEPKQVKVDGEDMWRLESEVQTYDLIQYQRVIDGKSLVITLTGDNADELCNMDKLIMDSLTWN